MSRRRLPMPTSLPPELLEDDPESMGLNDPNVEMLPDPPILGAGPRMDDPLGFGERVQPVMGRATSPKLYAQAAMFPNVAQLRVWKLENGQPLGLGLIEATATEEDLVRSFPGAMPKPGERAAQFKLRPIDINGNEMGQEITVPIHVEHQAVQLLRRAESAAPAGMMAGPTYMGQSLPPEMMGLISRLTDQQTSHIRALEESLRAERAKMDADRVEVAQERVALANNAASGVHAVMESTMKAEQARAEHVLNVQRQMAQDQAAQMQSQSSTLLTTLTAIFSQQQAAQQAAEEARRRADEYRLESERQRAERLRQEEEARRLRDAQDLEARRRQEAQEAEARIQRERLEYENRMRLLLTETEAKMARERDELERKERMAREEREAKERREATEREERIRREKEEREDRLRRDAEEKDRRERWEREASTAREQERQRQHERMMEEMKLSASQQREHAERMMSLSREKMEAANGGNVLTMVEKGAGMLKGLGIEPTDAMRALFGGGKEGEEPSNAGAWLEALPALAKVFAEVVPAVLKAKGGPPGGVIPEAILAGRPALTGPVGYLPPNVLNPTQVTAEVVPVPVGAEVVPVSPPVAPEASAAPVAAPAPAPEDPVTNTDKMAESAGLKLPARKTARNAIRDLVRKLRAGKKEEWQGLVAQAISNELVVYHYVNAVSARTALIEGGADADLAEKVLQAIYESGLAPSDFNYG